MAILLNSPAWLVAIPYIHGANVATPLSSMKKLSLLGHINYTIRMDIKVRTGLVIEGEELALTLSENDRNRGTGEQHRVDASWKTFPDATMFYWRYFVKEDKMASTWEIVDAYEPNTNNLRISVNKRWSMGQKTEIAPQAIHIASSVPETKESPLEAWVNMNLIKTSTDSGLHRRCYMCKGKLQIGTSAMAPSGIPLCAECVAQHIAPSLVEEAIRE